MFVEEVDATQSEAKLLFWQEERHAEAERKLEEMEKKRKGRGRGWEGGGAGKGEGGAGSLLFSPLGVGGVL